MLQYVKGTINVTLILGVDNMSNMLTLVDAAYALHEDIRNHTGGVTLFGKGV